MSQSEPIPIILCGKTEKIGAAVIDALKPEIEGEAMEISMTSRVSQC